MKKHLFKLFISFLFAGVLFGFKDAKAQTPGTMTFGISPVAHVGQYSTNNNNGANYYCVVWVQNASGNFVKTLYRAQLGTGKDVWEHCQVWRATNTTLPYGNVVDATTSATRLTYSTPISAVTWAATDTTNPTPFKLVPDGYYRVFIEFAWDNTYVMGGGRDTASFGFVKGPSSFSASTSYPAVTNFTLPSVAWVPATVANTLAITSITPVTYAAGAAVSVPFTKTGTTTVYANNVWTLQLSNASGSFTNPISVGTLATITSGTIAGTIPVGTPAGTGYRMRVVGSAPGTIGTNMVANITITNGTSPALTAAGTATVDGAFNVTFTDDATWRAAITAIKIGGTTLTAGSAITAGQIAFTPSASVPASLLQTSGSLSITVVATGYADATVTQTLGVGAASKLAIKTQLAAPLTSGAVFATQPAVYIQDQYGNLTASTAVVTATVGAGGWSIGGTATATAAAGTATFSGLTATGSSSVATIIFTSPSLTSLTSAVFTVSGALAAGTVTVGPTGTYTSFTKADGLFATINAGGLAGSVIASITGNITTEDGAVALNQWAESGGSNYTLTIQPSGARTISGTIAGALFTFNGADRVTIDGLNTGGNSLSISNLDASATAGVSTIKFIGDATTCTITNCTILGSGITAMPALPATVNGGTIYIATGIATGNDNITISNNKIGPAGTNLPSKGIYANGSSSAAITNSNILIDNNEIYDFSLETSCAGIYVIPGNSDWTISNNKFYQTATRTYTVAGTMFGINFSDPAFGNNIQITGNTIGYASATGTGVLSLNGGTTGTLRIGAFTGIQFLPAATSSSATTCNVNNNIITDISMVVTAAGFIGINSAALVGAANIVNINSNQVKNISHDGTNGAVLAINAGSAKTLTCSSNTIDGITKSATTTSGAITGIKYSICNTFTCNSNVIKNITANSTAATGAIYGFNNNNATTTVTLDGNSVYNITSLSTAAQPIYGYYDQFSGSGTKTISNNNIYNITAAEGAATINGIRNVKGTLATISGNNIYSLSGGINIFGINIASGNNNVLNNKIYGFTTANANPIVYGIYATAGTTNNISNNYIGGLATTAANSAIPLAGINIEGGTTSNVYYNTVYLTGTSSGALFGSAAIYASITPTVNLRNNIFVNNTTPTGAGFTSAYRRNGASGLAKYATTSNNNLFYAGTPSASKLIMYDGLNSYQTLAAYKTAMATRDAASISENPTWVSTTGSAATYLHIDTSVPTAIEGGGTTITGFTTDFDGDTRTTFDIGADEFTGAALVACSGTPAAITINGSPLCSTGSTGETLSLGTSFLNSGLTYQWTSSATAGGATTNLGTASTQTITPTATTYYICTVTCSNGGGTSVSPEKAITVTAVPSTPVVYVTDNCGSSDLTTTATGTLLWSNSATTSTITVTASGTSSVVQTVGGCSSAAGSATAAPVAVPATPVVTVVNSCGSSVLSTPAGTLLWSNASTASSITVTSAGAYTVTKSVNGCTSLAGTGTAAPTAVPATPVVAVVNTCGSSVLTSSGTTGTLLWSNSSTATSITITSGGAGVYTLKQTIGACSSLPASAYAAPIEIPNAPVVTVVNNCGNSVLTTGAAGTLAWSNPTATTSSITVTTAGTSTVTTTVNGCISAAGSGTAAPHVAVPVTLSEASFVLTSSALTGNVWHEVTAGALGSTGHTYTAIANGYYYSVVYDANNCVVNSDTIHVATISVESIALNENVKIYPNPTSDMVNIAFNQINGSGKLVIENALGVKIYEEQLEQTNGLVKSIDLSKFASGIYFINVQVQNEVLRSKVVLNR